MDKFKSLTSKDGRVVRLKVGFSWPAMFFGFFWAMFHRAWRLALVMGLAFYTLVLIDELFVRGSQNLFLLGSMLLAYVALMVVCGKYGNTWLASELLRKGYSEKYEHDA